MNNTSNIIAETYPVAEYQVALYPHQELCDQILFTKEEFCGKYNLPFYRTKPQITLVRFKAWEMTEPKIMSLLKGVCSSFPALNIDIRDYGSFPSHSIYLKVQSQEPIKQIQVSLRAIKKLTKVPDQQPHFLNEPFIAIAFKIPSSVYDKAWPEYQQKQFTGHFIADSISITKKKENGLGYRLVQKLPFMNKQTASIQAGLF
jgi:2'-5' RNA ligase